MPLLDVRELHVVFDTYLGRAHAVRDLSFSVEAGETIAIVGESGCGKSVTALSLMRLIPSPPGKIIGGEIWFEGEDLIKKSRREMRRIRGRKMGMIFQDPMTSLNPTMRIGAQIAEGLRLPKAQAQARCIELLEMVEISNPEQRLEQYPHELSGGQRQRVNIAIALACNPKLLIADEPTTALDVTIQAQILELLKNIQEKMGTTIILITHDLGIVAGNCDRMLVMYGGKIVEQGSVQTIFRSSAHPYTRGLLQSVPRLDMNRTKSLEPIPGTPPNLLNPPQGCPFWARCNRAMRICAEKNPPLVAISDKQTAACWENDHASSS
ncbi:MAG: ABC transporter ATP-binding protein [Chlamydiales bacterium]